MKTLCMVAIAILAGCGSQVAPTGGTSTGAASATHGKSWMLPEAKSENLLYVSNLRPFHFAGKFERRYN